MVKNIIRSLRLPFISVSIVPFIAGSLFNRSAFDYPRFLLGLVAVIATHLGSNLINDYADSGSGVDWQDLRYYNFFGGSKLIQERVFSPAFYLRVAIFCFAAALSNVLALAVIWGGLKILGYYLAILFLGIAYSQRPLSLSYHRLGELVLFALFGPALVMGGYFIQTGIFPELRSFLLSLPFGLLATAILFANEIPDYRQDASCGKNTWVGFFGPRRSYLLYLALMLAAFLSIAVNIIIGNLSSWSGLSFIMLIPAFKAASILKDCSEDKLKMVESSKLTITAQTVVGIILIAGLLL